MQITHTLRHLALALFAVAAFSAITWAADPGLGYPIEAPANDTKTGSLLVYNIYTSGASGANTQNTRINLTNTSSSSSANVHLFFVSSDCSVADSYVCLTASQTVSFVASDVDPGVTGYIVAIATDDNGCPYAHNWLVGDEYVKFASGHVANLPAMRFSAIFAGTLPGCDANSVTATINFTGIFGGYSLVPAVLIDENVASRADGNDTLLIVNRLGGNLSIGASTLATLFGVFFDDSENPASFSFSGGCQFRNTISNNFPRLLPRFETFIPAGRSGWFKIYNPSGFLGISGSVINQNTNATAVANAFSGGHNLSVEKLTTASYVVPVFPPSCN